MIYCFEREKVLWTEAAQYAKDDKQVELPYLRTHVSQLIESNLIVFHTGICHVDLCLQLRIRDLSIDLAVGDFGKASDPYNHLIRQRHPLDLELELWLGSNRLQLDVCLGHVDRMPARYRLHQLLVPGQLQNQYVV